MLRTVLGGRVRPLERPSMIVLADAGILGLGDRRAARESAPAVQTLCSHGIPVVLAASEPPTPVRQLQATLNVQAPFICAGGSELHIPGDYFSDVFRLGQQMGRWNVIEFGAGPNGVDYSRAIQLLQVLFWHRRDAGLTVGVTDRERSLLATADVPILVRNPRVDQSMLLADVPDVYYTSATGSAGWSEGILGSMEA